MFKASSIRKMAKFSANTLMMELILLLTVLALFVSYTYLRQQSNFRKPAKMAVQTRHR